MLLRLTIRAILSWTKSQIRARSHPNVLSATTWLNNMYHTKTGDKLDEVDLKTPLMYADASGSAAAAMRVVNLVMNIVR